MNSEEMTGPDVLFAQADSVPIHGIDPGAGGTASAPSPLGRVDALAVSTLSSKSLARYLAYKDRLLARDPDEAAVLSSLILFMWDLSENR